jgi:hypothetical protein
MENRSEQFQMFNYGSSQFKSMPGPEITLTISPRKSPDITISTPALLDTGSVITCVPFNVLSKLDFINWDYAEKPLRSIHGLHKAKFCIVCLKLANCRFENIEVAVIQGDLALVGRDILNQYTLTFNGLNQIWSVDGKCS